MSWELSIIRSTSGDVLNLFPKYLTFWMESYNNFQLEKDVKFSLDLFS
jgi:hypothetical protein